MRRPHPVILGIVGLITCSSITCSDVLATDTTTPASVQGEVEGPDTSWSDSSNGGEWLIIGLGAGGLNLDADLANYRWDTRPAAVIGGQATLGQGRFAAGLSFWRSGTSQATGIPGESLAPQVSITSVALLGQFRFASPLGFELWGSANVGRLHLDYQPDTFTVDLGGPNNALEVTYEPIDEWAWGLGLELRRHLARSVALAVQASQTSFGLDTAHRSGDTIVEQREHFTSWSVQLHLLWRLNLS